MTESRSYAEKPRRRPGSGTKTERPARSGRWQLRVYAGRDPVTGRPRQVTRTVQAKTERDANKALAAFITEVEARAHPETSTTVAFVLAEWLSQVDDLITPPGTIHEAQRTIDKVLVPAIGHVAVSDLTARHIELLYHQWRTGTGLEASTVLRHRAVLRAALNQAVRWGRLDENPVLKAKAPEPTAQALKVPSWDDVHRLMTAARARHRRWEMLIALAVATGARSGELCALRWTDVEADRIVFRRTLY